MSGHAIGAAGSATPIATYLDWIRTEGLPFWAETGFDPAAGRFRERLTLSGRPLAVPHRAMVQARQIYVYAHAASLGWFEGGALADRSMQGLIRDFCEERDGRASFAFSIDPGDGRVHSAVRDAYAHAFLLFAIAALHRLTGDAALLDLADRIIAFIDAELADDAHGGLHDAVPGNPSLKRQNPQMHLLEAYLALAEAAPGRDYLARADALVTLFERRLFDPRAGALLEYFAEDWSPHPDPAKAGVVEPGHQFEWAWLLDRHARLAGVDHGERVATLYTLGRDRGVAAPGLIYDELGIDGAPAKRSHRLWPHTEAIKAAAIRLEAGDASAADFAQAMASALTNRFVATPLPGGWMDQLDAQLTPAVDYVPASSLYHLFLGAAEAARHPALMKS